MGECHGHRSSRCSRDGIGFSSRSDDAQLSTAPSTFTLAVVLSFHSEQAAGGNDGSPDDDDCLLIALGSPEGCAPSLELLEKSNPH